MLFGNGAKLCHGENQSSILAESLRIPTMMPSVIFVAVARDHEVVGKAVGADLDEDNRGSDCRMTGATKPVSWVEQWLWRD